MAGPYKGKRLPQIQALRMKLGRWKWREERARALFSERCNAPERLLPAEVTRFLRQIRHIQAKQRWVQIKLDSAIRRKEKREAMKQLPPGENNERRPDQSAAS
jgi:hypothetical protein